MSKKRLLERNAVVVNAMNYFTSILKGKNNDYLQVSFKNGNLDIINGFICLRLDVTTYENGVILDFIIKPALFKAGITLELKDGYNFRKDRQGKRETNLPAESFNYDMFNTAFNTIDPKFSSEFSLSNIILVKDKHNARVLKPTIQNDINKGKFLLVEQRFLENLTVSSDYKLISVEKSSMHDNMENCYTKPLLLQNASETVKIIIACMQHAGKIW